MRMAGYAGFDILWINSSIPPSIQPPIHLSKSLSNHLTHIWSSLWRHNGRDGVSNHQLHDCLLNGLFRHRSKETSKLRVIGLCEGDSPVAGEFPAQRASIWWRHHDETILYIPLNMHTNLLCFRLCDNVIQLLMDLHDRFLSTVFHNLYPH